MITNKGLWFFNEGDKGTMQTPPLTPLDENKVRICSEYSSINYKDALAVSGRGKIFRSYPIVPGIDVSGVVTESKADHIQVGDRVLVTGCGMGESFAGGYQEFVDVDADHVIPCPLSYSTLDVMLLGTAGFTAALAMYRMEQIGQHPNMGPILVTGASGGVGSIAVKLFSKKGYEVIAQTEKVDQKDYLLSLGAKQVLSLADLKLGTRPLESVTFAGAVDNIGGATLPQIASHTGLYGNIASIGLASGSDFSASVMPHILRGVSIIGVSSTNTPRKMREEVWSLLSKTLTIEDLAAIHYSVVTLDDVARKVEDFFLRKISGRVIVKIASTSIRK